MVASARAAERDSRGEIKVKYTSTGRGKQQNTATSEPGLLFSEWITLMDGSRESLRLQVISSETLARCFLKNTLLEGHRALFTGKAAKHLCKESRYHTFTCAVVFVAELQSSSIWPSTHDTKGSILTI